MPLKSLKKQTARYDTTKEQTKKVKAPPKSSKPTTTSISSTRSQKNATPSTPANVNPLSPGQQQRLVDIFRTSFPSSFADSTALTRRIQTLKGHLYNRDFETAFGSEENLEAYAVRWSPTRALAYAGILKEVLDSDWDSHTDGALAGSEGARKHVQGNARTGNDTSESDHVEGLSNRLDAVALNDKATTDTGTASTTSEKRTEVVCIGGGAGAEIVAFAGLLSTILSQSTQGVEPDSNQDTLQDGKRNGAEQPGASSSVASEPAPTIDRQISLRLIDIAPWARVNDALYANILGATSTADKPQQALVKPSALSVQFEQLDALNTPTPELLTPDTKLITFLFTLNELYSTSLPKTTALLLSLTEQLASGAQLLVVDSPGSYSTVKVGREKTEEKKYPMHWLLDHTLLKSAEGQGGKQVWEKVKEVESRWCRLDKGVEYPLGLEDMRFQMHLYKRL